MNLKKNLIQIKFIFYKLSDKPMKAKYIQELQPYDCYKDSDVSNFHYKMILPDLIKEKLDWDDIFYCYITDWKCAIDILGVVANRLVLLKITNNKVWNDPKTKVGWIAITTRKSKTSQFKIGDKDFYYNIKVFGVMTPYKATINLNDPIEARAANRMPNAINLEKLEHLHFTLGFEMDKPSQQIGSLLNHCEDTDATLLNISRTEIERWVNDHMETLTPKELDEIVFTGPITFTNKVTKTFKNDKGYFTVRELVDNIVEFEKEDRLASDWFGGVDTHHRFFEGIYKDKDAYRICWGS